MGARGLPCAPMFLSDFDYELPDELIARHPTEQRRASRLLMLAGQIEDRQFSEFAHFLNAGDLLVFNDTRVIRARLRGKKETGGKVEVLIERILPENRCAGPGSCKQDAKGRLDNQACRRLYCNGSAARGRPVCA